MPVFGAPAVVEVFPEFAEGLLRIEKHSHIWVLAWLDGERDLLQVTPRGVTDNTLHGVFAVRSPARPNPIGLTAARVVSVRGLAIEVERLDFLDGTPVVDLKPYFVTRDAIFSATNAPIGRPADRDALRESLLIQAIQFHGERCPDLELAVAIVEEFRAEVLDFAEPNLWHIAVPTSRPHLVDAVMGITRATLGRGSLELHEDDAVAFRQGDQVWEYPLNAD